VNGEEATSLEQAAIDNVESPVQADSPEELSSESSSPPGEELRGQLVRQFEQWVDRMLAGEPPPEGIPEELLAEMQAAAPSQAASPNGDCDLYALFSALTTLSGEIRLQGRAFKQVADAVAPLANLPARLDGLESTQLASVQQLDRLFDRVSQATVETSLPEAKDALSVVFDLRDRLDRGLRTFDAGVESLRSRTKMNWLARLTGAAAAIEQAATATEALREGQRLTLSRLEAALHEWGVEQIDTIGEMFDPRLMTAVEVQSKDDVPDGTVLEVYRSGYMLHGHVLATAQVKVAKARTSAK
jgi:molecular chaperone GrpE